MVEWVVLTVELGVPAVARATPRAASGFRGVTVVRTDQAGGCQGQGAVVRLEAGLGPTSDWLWNTVSGVG